MSMMEQPSYCFWSRSCISTSMESISTPINLPFIENTPLWSVGAISNCTFLNWDGDKPSISSRTPLSISFAPEYFTVSFDFSFCTSFPDLRRHAWTLLKKCDYTSKYIFPRFFIIHLFLFLNSCLPFPGVEVRETRLDVFIIRLAFFLIILCFFHQTLFSPGQGG